MFKDILVFDGSEGGSGRVGRAGSGRAGDFTARARAQARLISGAGRGGAADARDRLQARITHHLARTGGSLRGLASQHHAQARVIRNNIVSNMRRGQSTAGQALRPSTSARVQRSLRADMATGEGRRRR